MIDAMFGRVDWTARDAVGVLVTNGADGSLIGAAVLRIVQDARASSALRLGVRFVDERDETRSVSHLISFAIDACSRSGAARLLVENVRDGSAASALLRTQGFREQASSFDFEGDLVFAKSVVREIAANVTARRPEARLVPFASCSAREFFALAANEIGAFGRGVEALQTNDLGALPSFSASFGVTVDGRLRGGIVANLDRKPAFIEMLAVDRRFSRLGLATLLIDGCADALLRAGATAFCFNTGQSNKSMLHLARRLECRQTARYVLWALGVR